MLCLDLGCGDAHILGPWLCEMKAQYIGVDICENAVSHGRALGLDVRQIEDAATLPLPDATFDLVICLEVLEHLFQPQLAAQEALRVLRPGGLFIASTPNVTHWRRRIQFFAAGRWDPYGDELSVEQPWRDPHIRFFTPSTLQRMLRMAGFKSVRIIGEQPQSFQSIPLFGAILARPEYAFSLPACFSRQLLAVASRSAATPADSLCAS